MSYYWNDEEETRRLERIHRQNKMNQAAALILWVLSLAMAFLVGYIVASPKTVPTIPPTQTSVPTQIVDPTQTPTIVPTRTPAPTSTPEPTQAPTSDGWIETVHEVQMWDLSGGGSGTVSVTIKHDGCFDGNDMWDCGGHVVYIKGIAYVDDFEGYASYQLGDEYTAFIWSHSYTLFFKPSFKLTNPPSLP